MIKIISAMGKDVEDCWKLSHTKELFTPEGDAIPKEWFEAIIREKQMFFVAKDDKKTIGFVMGERLAGNAAIVHLMSVDPKYRRIGIGTRLMDEFEKECRKRRIIVIVAYAYMDSKKIQNMLSKKGFMKGSKTVEYVKILKE
jgi:ribosomal protein S18 acetylase RimI-like enzyme